MAGSLMDVVRGLKAEKVAKLGKDLPVPRWEDPNRIILSVMPLDHDTIKRVTGQAERNKDRAREAELELTTAAALVASATVSVKIGDNPPVALHELDPEETVGANTIKALCLSDGDVFTLAAAVMKHSNYSEEAITEVLQGE